jgi:hypothetical protein
VRCAITRYVALLDPSIPRPTTHDTRHMTHLSRHLPTWRSKNAIVRARPCPSTQCTCSMYTRFLSVSPSQAQASVSRVKSLQQLAFPRPSPPDGSHICHLMSTSYASRDTSTAVCLAALLVITTHEWQQQQQQQQSLPEFVRPSNGFNV